MPVPTAAIPSSGLFPDGLPCRDMGMSSASVSRVCVTACRHLHERSVRQDVLAGTHRADDAAAQETFTAAEILAWQERQDEWRKAKAPALAAAIQALPEDDLQAILALRAGNRRWRLDLDDWHNLARGLLANEARGPRPAAPTVPGGTADVTAVRRVVLGVLLRGHVLTRRPRARRNGFFLRSVAEAAAGLPPGDVALLMEKWRTLAPDVAHRAALRVMRYGELNPANEHGDAAAARRFVRGMLTQVRPLRVAWPSRAVQMHPCVLVDHVQLCGRASVCLVATAPARHNRQHTLARGKQVSQRQARGGRQRRRQSERHKQRRVMYREWWCR